MDPPDLSKHMREDPIALEAYEQLADAYAAFVDTKAHNAHYERLACDSLPGQVPPNPWVSTKTGQPQS
jgi:hypothetical protein